MWQKCSFSTFSRSLGNKMYFVRNSGTNLIRHFYENWLLFLGCVLAVSVRLFQCGHECLGCYEVAMETPSPLLWYKWGILSDWVPSPVGSVWIAVVLNNSHTITASFASLERVCSVFKQNGYEFVGWMESVSYARKWQYVRIWLVTRVIIATWWK